jgi:hypothetical protein
MPTITSDLSAAARAFLGAERAWSADTRDMDLYAAMDDASKALARIAEGRDQDAPEVAALNVLAHLDDSINDLLSVLDETEDRAHGAIVDAQLRLEALLWSVVLHGPGTTVLDARDRSEL